MRVADVVVLFGGILRGVLSKVLYHVKDRSSVTIARWRQRLGWLVAI